MIVINEEGYPTIESLNMLVEEAKKEAYKEEDNFLIDMFASFLMDCYEADKKLQEMVFDRFGDGFVCLVILPIKDTERLDSYSFQLVNEDETVKIKKRDEVVFRDYCDTCFGPIKPFYNRVVEYYNEL